MALTGEQYDRIMNIYSERRFASLKEQQRRQEEAEKQIPAITVLKEELAKISSGEVTARLKKDFKAAEKFAEDRRKLLAMKKKLLIAGGFDEDYLERKYTCSVCRDTGYVDHRKCGCMKKLESEMLNLESGLPRILARQNFSNFRLDVFDNAEPIEKFLPGNRITQREYMRSVICPEVRNYLGAFESEGSHNLFLTGPAGTGKTFLSNCIAGTLIENQHSVIYVSAGEMFDLMTKNGFSREKDELTASRISRINECELLIIDDLGKEFATEFTKAKLFSLISHRLTCGLSTIISSNLSLNQVSGVYGEPVASRIIGEYTVLTFYGNDLRFHHGGNR